LECHIYGHEVEECWVECRAEPVEDVLVFLLLGIGKRLEQICVTAGSTSTSVMRSRKTPWPGGVGPPAQWATVGPRDIE
jgi:hypothetical protein